THESSILLLVGSGPLLGELRSRARRLNIMDRVRFCGAVPNDTVPAYLALASIFVLPSLDEGLPRAVLEAMSMRLPVVATAVGGVPEVVRPYETGLIVRPADFRDLAQGLRYALEHTDEAAEWGRRGRDLVVRES